MISVLRHDDTIPRENDGACKLQDLASIFRSEVTSSSHWSIRTWLSFLQRGGGNKKRFQYCADPSSPENLLYLRAIQGHSGSEKTLRDNVLLPNDFAEHIYHVRRSHDLHSFVQSGLIPGGKMSRKGVMRCFFYSPKSFVDQHKEVEYDLTKAQNCSVQKIGKCTKTTVYGCNLRFAQSKGLQFYQTRSNAIILHNTLPVVCIEKVVNMKSREELYSKCISLLSYRKE